MAKVTNERVEKESETVTRYACNNCDRRYDSREDDELHLLVLDASPQRKRNSRYSEWQDMRWGMSRSGGRNYFRMESDEKVDICKESCFNVMFLESDSHSMDSIDRELRPAIEVQETQHEVVTEEEDEYLCDKCGDSMGERPDHDVSLNPHFMVERRSNHALGSRRGDVDIERTFPAEDEYIRRLSDSRITASRDDSFDVCHGCAREMFGLGPVGESSNIIIQPMEDMVNAITNGIRWMIP